MESGEGEGEEHMPSVFKEPYGHRKGVPIFKTAELLYQEEARKFWPEN